MGISDALNNSEYGVEEELPDSEGDIFRSMEESTAPNDQSLSSSKDSEADYNLLMAIEGLFDAKFNKIEQRLDKIEEDNIAFSNESP